MAQDNYIVGKGSAPEWCRRYIAIYLRSDGTTGYEFYGRMRTHELKKGDMLTMDSKGKIRVKRKGK